MADILEEFQHDIEHIVLVPAWNREFEVDVSGELLFSKKALGRHANEGEIIDLMRHKIK